MVWFALAFWVPIALWAGSRFVRWLYIEILTNMDNIPPDGSDR